MRAYSFASTSGTMHCDYTIKALDLVIVCLVWQKQKTKRGVGGEGDSAGRADSRNILINIPSRSTYVDLPVYLKKIIKMWLSSKYLGVVIELMSLF